MRQILAEASSGQQILVTLWDEEEGAEPEVAMRADSGSTWGPPLKILKWDQEETDGMGKPITDDR